jgi:hydroxyethylthiazole kinase-like uncharacterized protein yjeF
MRALDKQAIEDFGITAELLMENAGHAAYYVLRQEFGICGRRFIVFCGTGNNGGDGCVLARKIHADGGWVKVFILGDPAQFKGAARLNFEIITRLPVEIQQVALTQEFQNEIKSCDLIVDAIFGTGLSRDVGGLYREIIEIINRSEKSVLSIDIPSGVHGNNGKIMGVAVKADYTVTFGLPKLGNLLFPGFELGGKLFVSHISFPPLIYNSNDLQVEINDPLDFPEIKDIDIDGKLLRYGDNSTNLQDLQPFFEKIKQQDFLILGVDELTRFSGKSAQTVGIDQWEALQNTAERIKKAIILKGIRPLMGFPDRRVYINLCGPVNVDEEIFWDSLGSTITVMLNLGFPIRQAIRQGVFIHFLARDLAVEEHRGSQLTNRDFLNDLPRVLKMLQEGLNTELINQYTGIQVV